MKLDKIKSLAFLFTIFFSSITFSQTQDLYTSECDANQMINSQSLTYTDVDSSGTFTNTDTADLNDPANSGNFNYGTTYYYYDLAAAAIYPVTFTISASGYDIFVGITPVTCSPGAGGTQQTLYTSACDAFSYMNSITLTYTDDDTSGTFTNNDRADLTDAANAGNFNYGTTYYYNDGLGIYEVTFIDQAVSDYAISVGTIDQSCSPGTGGALPSFQAYDSNAGMGDSDPTIACSSINGGTTSNIYFSKGTGSNLTMPEFGDTLYSDSNGNNPFISAGTVFFGWFDMMTNQNQSIEVDGTTGNIISIVDCTAGGAYTPYSIYDISENACSKELTTLTLYVLNENSLDLNDAIDSQNSFDISDFSATYYYNDGSNTYSISFDSPVPGNYIINTKNLINCAPSFTSDALFTAAENQSTIGTATATDPDAGATQAYSITGTELVIDASTGVITFAANPDFETKNSYTATVTVTDGTNTVTQDITVTVTDVDEIPPIITLIGEATVTIEVGGVYADDGATASDNYDGDISAGIVAVSDVDTDVVGNYTVTYNVTDANGNPASTVTRTVIVESSLSVEENEENEFKIYPNPTLSSWKINSSKIIKSLEIFDLVGRKVLSKKPMAKDFEIDASFLPTGIYVMVLNNKIISRLIKS